MGGTFLSNGAGRDEAVDLGGPEAGDLGEDVTGVLPEARGRPLGDRYGPEYPVRGRLDEYLPGPTADVDGGEGAALDQMGIFGDLGVLLDAGRRQPVAAQGSDQRLAVGEALGPFVDQAVDLVAIDDPRLGRGERRVVGQPGLTHGLGQPSPPLVAHGAVGDVVAVRHADNPGG